jgi:O-acetyl-ADP-ribose deacetylase (regulator of RNase III)
MAVSTTAGRMKARRVIHTVGPVWKGGRHDEERLLVSAYRNSLERARAEGLRSIAFPSISTGAYGYPVAKASRIAIDTVRQWLVDNDDAMDEVRFVLFSEKDYAEYLAAKEG